MFPKDVSLLQINRVRREPLLCEKLQGVIVVNTVEKENVF